MIATVVPLRPSRSTTLRHKGRQLRLIRIHLEFTQDEMGRLLCLSGGALSRLESGQRLPSKRTWELLKRLLQDPRLRERLEESGYPHPWPGEEGSDVVAQVLKVRPKRCQRCGLLLKDDDSSTRLCERCVQELDAERQRSRQN